MLDSKGVLGPRPKELCTDNCSSVLALPVSVSSHILSLLAGSTNIFRIQGFHREPEYTTVNSMFHWLGSHRTFRHVIRRPPRRSGLGGKQHRLLGAQIELNLRAS